MTPSKPDNAVSRGLIVLPLPNTPIVDTVVTTLQQHDQARNQADEPYDKANRRPVPVVYVHRCAKRGRADEQIEVRQAFVDWF